jgi:hypothetical protein
MNRVKMENIDSDPKTKFQSKLNTLLSDTVSKLESLANEVLPKKELDKLNKKSDLKTEK